MDLEGVGRAVAAELQAALTGELKPGIHKVPVRLIPRESMAGLASSKQTEPP